MIDNLTILSTTLAILFVVVRALRLDRTMPWFQARSEPDPKPAAEPRDRRRQVAPAPPPWRRTR
ncbi:MAG: hypothetical protein M3Y41_11280 [Pseudomonadota bacterium]|nr:hypothetical protein [Pseudomonadota bacterium]